VRQGQISELIAARPQNRRRVLEEAAGVSGLYGRRHEAELRVRAAQANLQRLEDLAGELTGNLSRLRREAHQAARYKALAADIRLLRARLLHARWAEARAGVARSAADLEAASRVVEAAARAAAAAAKSAIDAAAALPDLRDEATAAAAILHHLDIEADRFARALESARADVVRLTDEVARIRADIAREEQISRDAATTLDRLQREVIEVECEMADAPERAPQLRAEAETAESGRAQAEAAVEALASRAAAAEARRRAGAMRLADAQSRVARIDQALAQAEAEADSLGPADAEALIAARATVANATTAIAVAREAIEAAEANRADAARVDSAARKTLRELEDDLGARLAEARGLNRLSAGAGRGAFTPVLESVSPRRGLEAALAAALGDDLQAALDPRAPAFWAGREGSPPDWPSEATPLGPLIAAPPALNARLAFTAVVDRDHGPRLQPSLPPGARLVSREGDLWRWDGLTVSASAPRPAQVRLEQISRLTDLEREIADLTPRRDAARVDQADAARRVAACEEAVRLARAAPRVAEIDAARAREVLDRLERDAARREARAQSLAETVARLRGDRDEAVEQCDAARTESQVAEDDEDLSARLADARQAATIARDAAARAQSSLDVELRATDARRRRFDGLARDRADWTRRAESARKRQEALARDLERAEAALGVAREAPVEIETRRQRLLDELTLAKDRQARAHGALAAADSRRAEADRDARAADARAADAREARAGAEARVEAAQERLAAQASALTDATGLEPELIDAEIAEAGDVATETGVAELRLSELERERDAIGAVNLRAEEEAADLAERLETLAAERADLDGALDRLRSAIAELNAEGRERLTAAFEVIDTHFRALFTSLFQGGQAELRLVESDDPLEAGLEIYACPPGKRMAVMSLMSGGEQALTAVALIFAVFLANPAPICVLDEVDAPLDDANVERFCNLLAEMRVRAPTRFITITHHPLTMSRMDRLYGVTMRERGVSQLVSVDLRQAEAMAAR
jgi:chromosome segregation protein